MSNKTCVFQYATSYKVIEDTDLITEAQALALFDKYIPDFAQRKLNEENPEMAIWCEMTHSVEYKKTLKHWQADDMVISDDGWLCERIIKI